MTRRSRSPVPGLAKLASGVVIGGVTLGALLSLTIDPRMKRPAESARVFSGTARPAASRQDETWLNAGFDRWRSSDSYRPDLDYEAVAVEDWDFEADLDLPEAPAGDEVTAAADAAEAVAAAVEEAARPAAAPTQPATPPRKSSLAQAGIY